MVIASNDRAVEGLHQTNTLGRVGPLSCDVLEAEKPLKSPDSGVINDSFQSFDLSVNVRNEGEIHKMYSHKEAASSIFLMFVKPLIGIPS